MEQILTMSRMEIINLLVTYVMDKDSLSEFDGMKISINVPKKVVLKVTSSDDDGSSGMCQKCAQKAIELDQKVPHFIDYIHGNAEGKRAPRPDVYEAAKEYNEFKREECEDLVAPVVQSRPSSSGPCHKQTHSRP